MMVVVMGFGCELRESYRVRGEGVNPSSEGHRADVVGIGLSILSGDADRTDAPCTIGGRAGTILQLIASGDPFDLAGGKVRAGSESRHRSGVV
jgi:hypothetical protein